MKLKFKNANGKLKKMAQKLGVTLKTFTLPAGYTCAGAKDCLAFADRKTGKIKVFSINRGMIKFKVSSKNDCSNWRLNG